MGKIAITLPDKPKEQLVQLMALQTKNKRNKSMQVTDRERVWKNTLCKHFWLSPSQRTRHSDIER